MKSIYLVRGDNGQSYSDYSAWDVCATFDKAAAEKRCADAKAWHEAWKEKYGDTYTVAYNNPFDPDNNKETYPYCGAEWNWFVVAIPMMENT